MCGNVFFPPDQIRALIRSFMLQILEREEWELKNHAVGVHQARTLL